MAWYLVKNRDNFYLYLVPSVSPSLVWLLSDHKRVYSANLIYVRNCFVAWQQLEEICDHHMTPGGK